MHSLCNSLQGLLNFLAPAKTFLPPASCVLFFRERDLPAARPVSDGHFRERHAGNTVAGAYIRTRDLLHG